jgi:hypothetical protein
MEKAITIRNTEITFSVSCERRGRMLCGSDRAATGV